MEAIFEKYSMSDIAAESYLMTAISILILLLVIYLLFEGLVVLIPDWNLRLLVILLLYAALIFIFTSIIVRFCDYSRYKDIDIHGI